MLWLLVFFGFAVNYMIRININIAIVGMVKHPRRRGGRGTDECLYEASELTAAVPRAAQDAGNNTNSFTSFSNISTTTLIPIFSNMTNVVRLPVEDDVSPGERMCKQDMASVLFETKHSDLM